MITDIKELQELLQKVKDDKIDIDKAAVLLHAEYQRLEKIIDGYIEDRNREYQNRSWRARGGCG